MVFAGHFVVVAAFAFASACFAAAVVVAAIVLDDAFGDRRDFQQSLWLKRGAHLRQRPQELRH